VEADFDIRCTAARLRTIFRDAGARAARPARAKVAG